MTQGPEQGLRRGRWCSTACRSLNWRGLFKGTGATVSWSTGGLENEWQPPGTVGKLWEEGIGSKRKMEGPVVHVSMGDGLCFPGWEKRRWGAGEEI